MNKTFMLYGVSVGSGFRFRNRLLPSASPPDLTFMCSVAPPELPTPGTPVWERRSSSSGSPTTYFWRVDGGFVLRHGDISSFTVGPDRIECRVGRATDVHLVEARFLGPVMALWLEERGRTVLHSSAVAIGGRVTAFLGAPGAGKTSLAAAFVHRGHGLLTDDLLALEIVEDTVLAHAGYPVMRMWPDTAAVMAPGMVGERVHPDVAKLRLPIPGLGAFSPEPRPLERIYVLDRGTDDGDGSNISIDPIHGAGAIFELVRHSFQPELVHVMQLHVARFQPLARIAGRIPMFRLRFAGGYEKIGVVPEVTARHDVQRMTG